MMAVTQTPEAWLSANVRRGSSAECWEAAGGGYNKRGWHVTFKAGHRRHLAHRAAWEHEHGPIPPGLCVLHKCDNPRCCNPRHLFLGTRADNVADMWRKGRARPVGIPKGTKLGRAPSRRLDDDTVKEVFARYAAGATQKQIATSLSVSDAAISGLLRGSTYPEFEQERAAIRHLLGRGKTNGHHHP